MSLDPLFASRSPPPHSSVSTAWEVSDDHAGGTLALRNSESFESSAAFRRCASAAPPSPMSQDNISRMDKPSWVRKDRLLILHWKSFYLKWDQHD